MRTAGNIRHAFSLVELLTVITIIAVLISILLPSLNRARRASKDLMVRSGLRGIETGLEMFRADPANNGEYPPSRSLSIPRSASVDFTGAHWLAAAMVGVDLQGWDPQVQSDPSNAFREDNTDRRGPYIELDSVRTMRDDVVSPWPNAPYSRVLMDRVYGKAEAGLNHTIMYYRAALKATAAWPLGTVYSCWDNNKLIARVDNATGLGDSAFKRPGKPLSQASGPGGLRPMNPLATRHGCFYLVINNDQAGPEAGSPVYRPRKSESFILVAPGYDGLYGTADDISNFSK